MAAETWRVRQRTCWMHALCGRRLLWRCWQGGECSGEGKSQGRGSSGPLPKAPARHACCRAPGSTYRLQSRQSAAGIRTCSWLVSVMQSAPGGHPAAARRPPLPLHPRPLPLGGRSCPGPSCTPACTHLNTSTHPPKSTNHRGHTMPSCGLAMLAGSASACCTCLLDCRSRSGREAKLRQPVRGLPGEAGAGRKWPHHRDGAALGPATTQPPHSPQSLISSHGHSRSSCAQGPGPRLPGPGVRRLGHLPGRRGLPAAGEQR